jgi:hypothetical protein
MTSPLIDPLWNTYRDKILTDYPQAVPKGESYVKEYLGNWAQYLITQHGMVSGTAYIQKINSLLNTTSHQPSLNGTSESVSSTKFLDPVYWKSIKVFRDDWKPVKKCIERYERQIGRDLRFEEID